MTTVSVAIPLYIYPEPHAWDVLYDVATQYPLARFNLIINPNNGPGGTLPDSNYIREVARLNTFENVVIFGYVHVSWGNRDPDLVREDVADWSRWQDYVEADIHIHGVFIDEAPSDPEKLEYMAYVYKEAKHYMGQQAPVWTNPGVNVDQSFYAYADLVNAHENSHAAWLRQSQEEVNHKTTTMIHSYSRPREDLVRDINTLHRQGYCAVLITTETCYTSFSQQLDQLVHVLSPSQQHSAPLYSANS